MQCFLKGSADYGLVLKGHGFSRAASIAKSTGLQPLRNFAFA